MKKLDYFATGAVALVIILLCLWWGSRGWSTYELGGMKLNYEVAVLLVAATYLIIESIRLKSMPVMTLLGCLVGLLISFPAYVFYPGKIYSHWRLSTVIGFTIVYGIIGLIISVIPAVKKLRQDASEKLKLIGDPDSFDVLKIALKHEDASIRNEAIRRLKKIGGYEALEIVKLHKWAELAKIDKAEEEKKRKKREKRELLERQQNARYYCPKCKKRLPFGTTVCPKCRVILDGIRCSSCGLAGPSSLFVSGRCPRCR